MKKTLFTLLATGACMVGGVLALTACDPALKDYDMSNFVVEGKTVDYNGQEQGLKLTNLPQGLKATVKYYSDEEKQELVESPVNAGTYYATISFEVEEGFNAVLSIDSTFTINKVAYGDDVDVTLKVGVNETTTDENGDLHFAYKTTNGVALSEEAIKLTNVETVEPDFVAEFFQEADVDEDGNYTVNEDTQVLNAKLSEIGDVLYGRFTVADRNHTEFSVTKKITLEQYAMSIKTVDDLIQMNVDIYEIPNEIRRNAVYKLENDIDLQGAVWKTISPRYSDIQEGLRFFCSEFDGQGHKISNFKLTKDSLYYTLQADTNQDGEKETTITVDGLYNINAAAAYANLGFFGFAGYDAKLHDLKLENVEAQLDLSDEEILNRPGIPEGDGITVDMIHFGTLIGTLATMTDNYITHSVSIYNIDVNNVKADLKNNRIYAGGIIGRDGMNRETNVLGEETILRKNLNVTGLDFKIQYVKHGTHSPEFLIGGILGCAQPGDRLGLVECTAKGKVLVIAHDDEEETNYQTGAVYLGSVVGLIDDGDPFHNGMGYGGFVSIRNCYTDVAFEVYTDAEHKDNVGYVGVWGHDSSIPNTFVPNPDGTGCYNGYLGEDGEKKTEDDDYDDIDQLITKQAQPKRLTIHEEKYVEPSTEVAE